MATTIVPDPGPIDPSITIEDVLKFVHEIKVQVYGDYDKTTDLEDSAYYAGSIDLADKLEAYLTV